MAWQCPLCKTFVFGSQSKSNHYRNLYKLPTDASRCDNRPALAPPVGGAAAGLATGTRQMAPVVTAPAVTGTRELTTRLCTSQITQREQRATYTVLPNANVLPPHVLNLAETQQAYDRYMQSVFEVCSPEFWKFFLALHKCSTVAIDTALTQARRLFLQDNTDRCKMWAPTKRALFRRIMTVEPFRHLVMHSSYIDVSQFHLPSGTTQLKFEFVDPTWGWLWAARRQDPKDLHWRPVQQGAVPMYGGGVQYGKAFLEACESCPPGSYPMCLSLHWDGTGAHGVSAAPIAVGVVNTNTQHESTHSCLGYMPHTPDVKKLTQAKATKLKHYIRQQCFGVILGVLERAAETGVLCPLKNQHGIQVNRLLFPRLMAMNCDQPEAQLVFGLRNRTSCSKCRWRKGRSAFRKASTLSGTAVKHLYTVAHGRNQDLKDATRSKLLRWGFNPERRCALHTRECYHLLVSIPGTDEVYPCVDYRDVMHGLKMFLHRVCFLDALCYIPLSKDKQRVMMQRLRLVLGRQVFRDRYGTAYRRTCKLFSEVNMSAVDKVNVFFLLPHILGPSGDILPEPVRDPMMTALAQAQLMLIACSGHRAYTVNELKIIFDRGYRVLFTALEQVHSQSYMLRVLTAQRKNKPVPTPHRRTAR